MQEVEEKLDQEKNPEDEVAHSADEEQAPSPIAEAKRALEATILVSTDPAADDLLARVVGLTEDIVRQLCLELAAEYDAEDRGFELREVAGGWRYQTKADLSEYMERFAMDNYSTKISSAALETLSIVAYKQPLSRAQMSAIRGVNVDGVLKTLVQRGYVEEIGQDEGPGRATLFGTSQFFLEQVGLASLEDLPPLGDFVPSAKVLEILEETLRIDESADIEPETPPTTAPVMEINEVLGLDEEPSQDKPVPVESTSSNG